MLGKKKIVHINWDNIQKKKKKLNQQALSHENFVVGIPNLQRAKLVDH